MIRWDPQSKQVVISLIWEEAREYARFLQDHAGKDVGFQEDAKALIEACREAVGLG